MKWISAKVHPKPHDGTFLVMRKNGDLHVSDYHRGITGVTWREHETADRKEITDVAKWMPLPECLRLFKEVQTAILLHERLRSLFNSLAPIVTETQFTRWTAFATQ